MIYPAEDNDVYSWDGKAWGKIKAQGPPAKTLSSGALNGSTGDVCIFGGIGKKGYQELYGDTWRFDGNDWRSLKTNNIGTRDHHKMVYAQHLRCFVLYGGFNGRRERDSSTWILQNSRWSELHLKGPGSRYHFGMAYDAFRKKVVLYGGYNYAGIQKDTWEFDGQKWKKVSEEGPGNRGRFCMAYDTERKMVILHGGDAWKKSVDTSVKKEGETWDVKGDTWGWNGKQWILISKDGPARMLSALGYDAERKTLVLYGGIDGDETGYSDTWEFRNNVWVKMAENDRLKWNGKEFVKETPAKE